MSNKEFWELARVLILFLLCGAVLTTCRVLDNIDSKPNTVRIGPAVFDISTNK